MNKICAAGTGSFLEEQAERLGVQIKDDFAARALQSTHPAELGSKCTVFMDAALCHALSRSVSVADACAGLSYSVARNYLEKVVAGREIGDTIMFQGGTSKNDAVVAAFESLLDKQIHVHPFGNVSGAIGAALLSMRAFDGSPSAFRGFDAVDDVSVSSFVCKSCDNRCKVNRVNAKGRIAHFGDVCEKFAALDGARAVASSPDNRTATNVNCFLERKALLHSFLTPKTTSPVKGARRVGLVQASLQMELLPFWFSLVGELGFEPVLLPPQRARSTGIHPGAAGHDVCLPLKLAAAEVGELLQNQNVDAVLLPAIQHLPARQEKDRSNTCLFTQCLPDMVKANFDDRVLTPLISISDKKEHENEAVFALAQALERPVSHVRAAWRSACLVQQKFAAARLDLGRRALQSIGSFGAVVVGKPYNLHDERANLFVARHLFNAGIPAVPMDLLPLDDEPLSETWHMLPWRFNRDQVRALQFASRRGNLFPVHVSSYGCGPDAFFLPTTRLPCLLSQYGDGFRKVLSDLKTKGLLIFDPHPGEMNRIIGAKGTLRLYEGLTVVDILISLACRFRPFEREPGEINSQLNVCLMRVEDSLEGDGDMKKCLEACLKILASVARYPFTPRPVIGVTGDLYTRVNDTGNASLFQRLENMGCMVWPSPFYAAAIDFELPQDAKRFWARREFGSALKDGLSASILKFRHDRIVSALPDDLKPWCAEQKFSVLQSRSLPYVNQNTNHLIRGIVAKMADFAANDVDGIISAIGVGCMVGVSAAAIIPAIRDDFDGLPIVSIAFDGKSSASESMQIESFVHQVKQRFEAKLKGRNGPQKHVG